MKPTLPGNKTQLSPTALQPSPDVGHAVQQRGKVVLQSEDRIQRLLQDPQLLDILALAAHWDMGPQENLLHVSEELHDLRQLYPVAGIRELPSRRSYHHKWEVTYRGQDGTLTTKQWQVFLDGGLRESEPTVMRILEGGEIRFDVLLAKIGLEVRSPKQMQDAFEKIRVLLVRPDCLDILQDSGQKDFLFQVAEEAAGYRQRVEHLGLLPKEV